MFCFLLDCYNIRLKLTTLQSTYSSTVQPAIVSVQPELLDATWLVCLFVCLFLCLSRPTAQTGRPIRMKFGMLALLMAGWCAFYKNPDFFTFLLFYDKKTGFLADSAYFGPYLLGNKALNQKSKSLVSCAIS